VVWPFETSEPLVTPERQFRIQCERLGLTPEQYALPPTLLATFQSAAYRRLLERAGVEDQTLERGGGSGVRQLGHAVGSAGDVPVALAHLSMGAPAAAFALEEAIARGVRNVLVVGSAGSLQPDLSLGSTVIVEGAEREDGTSHHYLPAGEVVRADAELTSLLEACALVRGVSPLRGRSWTIDAPYRETVGAIRRHRNNGVAVVEMEVAAIFAVAQVRGVRAGLIVAVSDELFDDWNPGFAHLLYLEALVRAADIAMDVAARLGATA
jgi:purine-nucleoside phosphorylase